MLMSPSCAPVNSRLSSGVSSSVSIFVLPVRVCACSRKTTWRIGVVSAYQLMVSRHISRIGTRHCTKLLRLTGARTELHLRVLALDVRIGGGQRDRRQWWQRLDRVQRHGHIGGYHNQMVARHRLKCMRQMPPDNACVRAYHVCMLTHHPILRILSERLRSDDGRLFGSLLSVHAVLAPCIALEFRAYSVLIEAQCGKGVRALT